MNTVMFSSWKGKIVDNRKATAKKKQPEDTVPMEFNGGDFKVLMGWNGLVINDPGADIFSLTLAYLKEARKLSCGECSVCMIGIDLVLDVLARMSCGEIAEEGISQIERIVSGVATNAKCNFGRSAALVPVGDAIHHFKADFLSIADGKKKTIESTYNYGVTAPCMEACPAHLDIPGYIELIKNVRFLDSLDLIRERCILPGVLGRACTHPCEEACIRKDLEGPLAIRLLKRAAADYDLQTVTSELEKPREEQDKRVAIVGAGPAGLAAAFHLRRRGYQVTIFEALPKAGGMAAVGIPDYRLPKDVLQHEVDLLRRQGIEIKCNSPVEKLDIAAFDRQGFAAIFVAVGAHVGTKIGCEGEDKPSPFVVQGVDFLRRLNLGEKIVPQEKVTIIGGGNVALDCARSCIRLGFKRVEIVYRRSRKEMPGNKEEIEEALQEGVKISYLAAPVKILYRGDQVIAIECLKMKLGEPDESGRKRPVPIEGSNFKIKTDMVIAATGQKPDLSFLSGEHKTLCTTTWGTIKIDETSLQTPVARIFAGGDCVSGPATLIEALDMGNRAAEAIDKYLRGEKVVPPLSWSNLDLSAQRTEPSCFSKKEAMKAALLPLEERLTGYDEVERGLTANEARAEADRCLRCYRLVVWR